jgi:hypothetical protein
LQSVVVIWRCKRNRINRAVFQKPAKVSVNGGPFPRCLFELLKALPEDPFIDVAQSRDFNIIPVTISLQMVNAAAS